MYSGGLPILYPFASIFFLVLYWVYKFLLVKFYEKTTKFNEGLPLFATQLFKFGIIIHGIITAVMLTNSKLFPDQSDEQLLAEYKRLVPGRFHKGYAVFYVLLYVCIFIFFFMHSLVVGNILACISWCKKNYFHKAEEELGG